MTIYPSLDTGSDRIVGPRVQPGVRVAVFTVAALLLAAPASARADDDDLRLEITGLLGFSIGSVDGGGIDGYSAPGGHLDLGVGYGRVRAQLEFDRGMWSRTDLPTDTPPTGIGGFRRYGIAARLAVMELDFAPRHSGKRGVLHVYVEAGIGRARVWHPDLLVERQDLALGFGVTQIARLGNTLLGGHLGLRVLFADPGAEPARLVCRGPCPAADRMPDVGLFVVLGIAIGRSS
jgi:hypothetical protein